MTNEELVQRLERVEAMCSEILRELGIIELKVVHVSHTTFSDATDAPLAEVDDFGDDVWDSDPADDDDDPAPSDAKPKHKTSDARHAHVAEAQRKHRRRLVEYERKAVVASIAPPQPTIDELIVELQKQSMGTGVMPSKATFDVARPTLWATANEQARRHGMAWSTLATEAGLRVRPSRHVVEAG